jgi:hypothetical protein
VGVAEAADEHVDRADDDARAADARAHLRHLRPSEKGVRLSLVHPFSHTKLGWH